MPIRLWGSETIVNSTVAGTQAQPAIAALSSGGMVIAWVSGTGTAQVIRFQVFGANGAPLGPERGIPLFETNTTQISPDITVLSNGFFTIGYSEVSSSGGQDTRIAEFGPDGSLLVTTSIDSSIANTSPAVLDFGSFTTALGFSNGDIQIQFRDINNIPTGQSGTLNTQTTGTQDQLALDFAGVFGAAVWRDSGAEVPGLRIKGFSANDISGTEIVLQNDAIDTFTFSSTTVGGAHVAMIDQTTAVVVWEETTNSFGFRSFAIKAMFFDTIQNTATPIALGNFAPIGNAGQPQVIALSGGRFAIGYVEKFDDVIDGNVIGPVKIQFFNADGQKEGSAFTVNNALDGQMVDPQFTALADGRIAITWTANANALSDGDGLGIVMQIVDPRDGVIDGGTAAETVMGHDIVNDQIRGFAGTDTLFGLGGDDALYGGDGDDQLLGGRGDDVGFGGTGSDDLRGGSGEDSLDGETGNDIMRGGKDDDELRGGSGDDILIGGKGADVLTGGEGLDTASYIDAESGVTAALDGSRANRGDAAGDTYLSIENLTGSGFADTLLGNAASNVIIGGAGSDTIDGRAGSDTITGGASADNLTGGTGNDVFVYNARAEGGDTIADFSSAAAGNNDRFQFKGSAFGGLAAGNLTVDQFRSSNAGVATTADVRFFYERDTGILRFDADGNDAGAAIIIATLQPGAAMVISDILIV